MGLIYLDNAATSWPKPEDTYKAMDRFSREIGGSPGRSGHRVSIESARIIFNTRDSIARLLGIRDPLRIVFTKNATEALNIVINSLMMPGDHAIVSGTEHNAVMRPLHRLKKAGAGFDEAKCSMEGELDPMEIRKLIKKNTRVIFLQHGSNVTGAVLPVAEVGKIARDHGVLLCVDSAQTAGTVKIDMETMNVDLLAFTGHKALFGPQGTGGLYIREGLETRIEPLITGGTGSMSEHYEQPDFIPDRYESGTANTPGIAGLGAGIEFVLRTGIDEIRKKEIGLAKAFIERAGDIRNMKIFGPADMMKRTSIVSFLIEGRDPAQTALELDERFGIMSRSGLHCSPSAHRNIGTFPKGTNRVSFGFFNTVDDVECLLNAIVLMAANK